MPPESKSPDPHRSRLSEAWNRGWLTAHEPTLHESSIAQLRNHAALGNARLAKLFGGDLAPGMALDDLLDAEETWTIGDVLDGRYRIEEIHEGGFGRVVICLHLASGGQFALKTPRWHLLRDPFAAEAFASESERWVQLGAHPHLIQAYGLERISGRLFLVLEAVPGSATVVDAILRGEQGWSLALRVGAQVAAALAHGERRMGLIHGDLKPANILLAPDGTAKLTDFGISFARGWEQQDRDSGSHTPGYTGPEFDGRAPRTTATDMYAFGVTLWQCLTGQPVTSGVPHPLPSDTPDPLARLIRHCLAYDSSQRPGSFLPVARTLADCHRALLGTVPEPGYLPPGVGPLTGKADAARQATNLALSLRELDRLAEAEIAARRAVDLDPDYAAGHDVLGCVLLDNGKPGQAVVVLNSACRLAPNDIVARLHLGRALFESGEIEAARAFLLLAIAAAEQPGGDLGVLGLDSALLVQLLPAGMAAALHQRIVSADPKQLGAWINLVGMLRSTGATEAALSAARMAINLHPGDGLAWGAMSGALLDADQPAEALEAAERALSLSPDSSDLHAQHVAMLWNTGEHSLARTRLQEAQQRWPGSLPLQALRDRLRGH